MSRLALEVADILRRHGDAYREDNAGHLSRGQLKVMGAVRACRTAALGGHIERCGDCGHSRIAYNSCGNRHCPKCQAGAAHDWLQARQADLLPVEYFHVVFTLPAPIAAIGYQNKAVVYAILFEAAAETLRTIAADKKHLGARIGITMVTAGGRRSRIIRTFIASCRAVACRRMGPAGSGAGGASSCPCASSPVCSAACF